MRWIVAVLAAGKGTRMKSALPKVLHPAAGRPLLDYVLDVALELFTAEDLVVVVGHGAEEVRRHLEGRRVSSVLQEPQLGTGDALRVALEFAQGGPETGVIVLSGDVPLLRSSTLAALQEKLGAGAHAAVLTAVLAEPGSYGRILRDANGGLRAIVEAGDADEETLRVNEVNAGVYAFRRGSLDKALADLRPDNAQGEYYLTDVAARLREAALPVAAVRLEDPDEMLGVNTRSDLALVERILRARAESAE